MARLASGYLRSCAVLTNGTSLANGTRSKVPNWKGAPNGRYSHRQPDINFDACLGPDPDAQMRGLCSVSRRQFMQFCAGVAATVGLSSAAGCAWPRPRRAARAPVIWLHGQECTGCTETLLRSYHPTLESLLLDVISLDYHETLCVGAGQQALDYKHAMMAKQKGNTCWSPRAARR